MIAVVPSVLAAAGGKTLWYLTRGTGVVTLTLLTASMVLGIITTIRWENGRWPRFVTAALHRNVSLLVVVFLLAHIATTVLDGFVPIGWLDAVVPFVGSYRPMWLGLGAVAFDLLLAVAISSVLRERIGQRTWRYLHWSAYACWPLAIVHGLGTGFDAREGWMIAVDVVCVAAVLAAVAWRIATADPGAIRVRVAAAGLAVAFPIGLAAFAISGPMRPTWQRHAAGSAARFTGISGPVVGTVSQVPLPGGWVSEAIDLTATGSSTHVDVALRGRRLPGGGIGGPAGSMSVGPSIGVITASGAITGVHRGVLSASTMRAADGSTWAVTLDLTVDHRQGTARGSASARLVAAAARGGS